MPLTCYLDAFSGISGDMLVGALADAGADQTAIAAAIAALEIGATVSFEKVKRRGIGATKFHVAVEHQHAHRHLSHIVKIIEKATPRPAPRKTRSPFSKSWAKPRPPSTRSPSKKSTSTRSARPIPSPISSAPA